MKGYIKTVLQRLAKIFIKINNKHILGRIFNEQCLNEFLELTHTIKHDKTEFKFYAPNFINKFRIINIIRGGTRSMSKYDEDGYIIEPEEQELEYEGSCFIVITK